MEATESFPRYEGIPGLAFVSTPLLINQIKKDTDDWRSRRQPRHICPTSRIRRGGLHARIDRGVSPGESHLRAFPKDRVHWRTASCRQAFLFCFTKVFLGSKDGAFINVVQRYPTPYFILRACRSFMRLPHFPLNPPGSVRCAVQNL